MYFSKVSKLEKEKYITITKGFLNDYQHASVEITNTGIDAFEEYYVLGNEYLLILRIIDNIRIILEKEYSLISIKP